MEPRPLTELPVPNHWQDWTPLLGAIMLYIGLRIRVIPVDEE